MHSLFAYSLKFSQIDERFIHQIISRRNSQVLLTLLPYYNKLAGLSHENPEEAIYEINKFGI